MKLCRDEGVFTSLQGEGPQAGVPMTFVRLAGCNLRCAWCDTKYSWEGSEEVDVGQLTNRVVHEVTTSVCITGGEPLLQADGVGVLVRQLRMHRRCVAIETNGSLYPPSWWKEVVWDVDYKCPSAQLDRYVFHDSWRTIGRHNRVKFVVADERDLAFVLDKLPRFIGPLQPTLVVSPVLTAGKDFADGEVYKSVGMFLSQTWLRRVWQFCVDNDLRFSLQLHKVVFGNRKGV